jgi:Carboxypeptidase regulatory-like domain
MQRQFALSRFVGLSAAIGLTVALTEAGQSRDPKPVPQPRTPTTPAIQVPPRDRPSVSQVGTAAIRGRVVDGVTGRPVARARVRLDGRARKGPVLTDGNGEFAFSELPAGPYSFFIERNGYLPTSMPEQGRSLRGRGQPVTVRDGEERDDVGLTIFRGGAIVGRVSDTYGEPVDGASIMLLSMARGRWIQRGGTQSNDLGEFRVSRLPPGPHLLLVRAQMGFQNDPGEKPLPQSLPTYYPGTLRRDQARPIVLNRGETVTGIELTMLEGVPSIINGVVAPTAGQTFNGGQVTARLLADSMAMGMMEGGGPIRPDGTFRFLLPPGEYLFEARARPGAPGQPSRPDSELFGMARVSVAGGGSEDVSILVGQSATASGRVIFQGKTPAPPSPGTAGVPIFSQDGQTCRGGQATIAADWSFRIEGLIGTCSASPRPIFGRWMLKSVMLRGQELMDQVFTFEPGQHYGDLQIVVTDSRNLVDVRVTDDEGQPAREFVAVAFSAARSRWSQLQRYVLTFVSTGQQMAAANRQVFPPPAGLSSDPTAARMALSMGRLGPFLAGEYHVIALDDIEYDEMLDPGVLEKLIPSATRVLVSDDAPVEVSLRRFLLADLVR